ncbi:MAG: methyltransferase domain-containing protein [Desulfobacteraceae bacterium]|nr:methyltransferase domain-containing protein [Desulfobacteraceae bacterium]
MDREYEPQVSADCYEKHAFHPLRIESITEQLRQISYSGYNNILKIGVGKGFLKHGLQLFPQIKHTTIDIAERLCPDYVGSATNMPFEDGQFELVVCGQVLEHLPFTDFLPALKEIRRVTRHKAIISLPDKRRHFGFAICLARFGWFRFEWNPARRCYARREFEFNGEHYWEIGCKGTLIKDVVRNIRQAGFKIEKQYRLRKHPWHCFFILRA